MDVAITPTARAPVERSAIATSPLIFAFSLSLIRRKDATITTGKATVKGATFAATAIAIAPKPTWESPSPIIENFLSTRLTPRRAEQREIITPAIRALKRKLSVKSIKIISFIFLCLPKNRCRFHSTDIRFWCRKSC